MKKQVVIIGSGVIGLFCAYYLSEEGHDVIILDKDSEGSESNCSARNAGMIVPSHFIPMASPGIISQGIRWMFNSESPFYIRPQVNRSLLYWLMKFWMASTKNHVNRSSPALLDYNSYSLRLYRELSEKKEFDFKFRQDGLLMICKTEKGLHEEATTAETAKRLGLITEIMDSKRLREYEPGIRIDAAGAVLFPGDAHLHPTFLLNGLKGFLRNKTNVSFVLNTQVKELRRDKEKITAVITSSGGTIPGEEFVLAAGALSPSLCRASGLHLPIIPGKGYSLTVNKQGQHLRTPSILCEARVAVTPFENEIRFGGTMELGSADDRINPLRVDGIINSAKRYFPLFDKQELKKASPWSGLRPCTPDGLPYLGRFLKYNNLVAATGHSMMGLSLAPATGKIVSDIISQKAPSMGLGLFSPDRYK